MTIKSNSEEIEPASGMMMHMKFSRNRGDRISNLDDSTGSMTPVPAVLGLSHPNRPVIVLSFLLVIFLSGSLPPAAGTAVRNCCRHVRAREFDRGG